jgi:hypothetical protein
MNKPYLLIAGDNLYPSDGTGDWIKCYESVAEAREKINYLDYPTFFSSGKMKGQLKSNNIKYTISDSIDPNREYNWYEIVDLREWTQ